MSSVAHELVAVDRRSCRSRISGGGDLFSEQEDDQQAPLSTTHSRLNRAGSNMNAKGSAEVLSHLLHAMDDDLESDNLFTSVSKSLGSACALMSPSTQLARCTGSPLSSATASQQPTQSAY